MLIKVINFQRKTPRGTTDLRRLFKYLLTPKIIENKTGARLLGPPQFDHLVLTTKPWGDENDKAVTDLVEQFDFYVREACVCQRSCARPESCKGLKTCIGRGKPDPWFVHIIFSFAPIDENQLRSPADQHTSPSRWASTTSNTIRIARDALDFLGWDAVQPSVFVVHGDTDHIHIHAVIATPVFPDAFWNVFKFQRRELFEVAKIAANAFNLSVNTPKIQRYYRKFSRV